MLLVRTPSPYPTESLLGYILRITETNGYGSPNDVFAVAGIPEDGRKKSMEMDIGKLAAALGKQVDELRPLVYSDERCLKRNGLLLGQPVVTRHLRIGKQMLCPKCVADRGFVEALWDSALVIACPRHRCELIGACPACGKKIGNRRKGLLTCGCGASLLDAASPMVSDETADLMAVLASKIAGDPAPAGYASGLPVAELSKMSLRTLQVVIASLGWQQLMSEGADREQPIASLVWPAAQVLRDWPTNFYGLLRRVGERSAQKTPFTIRFLKRHESISGALFKKGLPQDEIRFLREAFVRYGMEEWGESIARFKSPDFDDLSVEKKLLTRSEIATHLGVSRDTIYQWQPVD